MKCESRHDKQVRHSLEYDQKTFFSDAYPFRFKGAILVLFGWQQEHRRYKAFGYSEAENHSVNKTHIIGKCDGLI